MSTDTVEEIPVPKGELKKLVMKAFLIGILLSPLPVLILNLLLPLEVFEFFPGKIFADSGMLAMLVLTYFCIGIPLGLVSAYVFLKLFCWRFFSWTQNAGSFWGEAPVLLVFSVLTPFLALTLLALLFGGGSGGLIVLIIFGGGLLIVGPWFVLPGLVLTLTLVRHGLRRIGVIDPKKMGDVFK